LHSHQGNRKTDGQGNQKNRFAHANGCDIALFKRTCENPRPEVEIESLEFQSTMSPCQPALVAITVE